MKRKALIAASVLLVCAAASAALVMQSSYAQRAKNALVRVARSEVHLLRVKRDFERPAGEIAYSGPMLVIAHAGGAVNGKTYRNAREGLDQSSERGCRYMELDFNWTADNKLVTIHDWSSFFDEPLKRVPTEKEFLERI